MKHLNLGDLSAMDHHFVKHILSAGLLLLTVLACSGSEEQHEDASRNLGVAHQATTSTPTPTTCEQQLQPVAATASSIEGNNSNWAAAKAIDGNTGTRWSSAFSDPQWLKLDLGASKAISKVVLSWQNSYSTDYDIQVSATGADGSWTTVYTQPNGDGGTDEITGLSATGRYVRMYSRHRKTQYGNSLWEVKVYEDTCPCQGQIQPLSATASSIEGSNWVASKAIDGNFSSRWSSAFSDPQWLSIDLGATYNLNRVVLHWENAASANYDLQVSSNGTSWSNIYTNTNGHSGTQDIPNLTAQGRYLRVYSRARTTQYGVSLWEVEAFQETCNTCTPTGTSETVCNGVDDDCDGAIDENYQPTVTNCGMGACAAAGVTACVSGAVVNSCVPGAPAANDATCNGVDNDCNGQIDEDFVGQATSCGVGACAATGVQTCVNGSVVQNCTPGAPAASDATCNNVDDDCDGANDENYPPQPSSCGIGACAATGTISCTNGSIVNSCASSAPAANDASCNGVDDDCNGAIDEDYVVAATSCGVGACGATGVTACLTGSVIDSCTPGAPAVNDTTCNGMDDDCDGAVDENYVSVPTTCGIGGCTNAGATSCVNGAVLDGCVPLPAAADDSLCDGVDTDCDGATDEGYAPVPATCGVGACAATGVTSCVSGAVHSSCVPGSPALDDTTCDGVDNDCNSEIDEDYVSMPTSCGIGECAATGTTSCVSGMVQDSCTPGNAASDDSLCDGLDNDCSGAIDEDYQPHATSCGVGACADTGVTSCVAGAVADSCSPGEPALDDMTCDLVDDDCDGTEDEDYLPENTTCGVGECAATGATSCVEGDLQDNCTPGAPTESDSLCDGLDNDCNGATDEDYVISCSGEAVLECENGTTVSTSCSNDDACDGEETCSLGVCQAGTPPSMDDGNPCTTDTCDPQSGISHSPATAGTVCVDDGNVCNGSETCDGNGACVAGNAPSFDDGNPCTADACDSVTGVSHTPLPVGSLCADSNVCNGTETCNGSGTCVAGTPLPIDDGNPCTADACDPQTSTVSHTPVAVGTSCADSNQCNGNETCNATGSCVAGTAPTVNDNNPCTNDTCNPATGVIHTPTSSGSACGDADLCNGQEACNGAGACVTFVPGPVINDGNPCTNDVCVPSTGVVNHPRLPTNSSCSDGNVCNGNETCSNTAVCRVAIPQGLPPPVADSNPCTIDSCDPITGVSHVLVPAGTSCADSSVCNGAETCDAAGTCVAGTPLVVDDDHNPCTEDFCSPTLGIVHQPVAIACPDGNLCNGDEICGPTGICQSGTPLSTDDGNACTTDTCNSSTGAISHTPLATGSSCSDNNVCNGNEVCNASASCLPGTALVVSDGNPCTADSCDPLTGVAHSALPLGTSCSDGNACNGAETCDAATSCVAGTPPMISDNNPCTTDICNPSTGVAHTLLASGTSCADNDLCNGDEICNGSGTCLSGIAPELDDGNPCTDDACDPSLGPTHTPIADDQDECTLTYCDAPTETPTVVTCSPIDTSVITTVENSLSFLYEGDDAPQQGVEPGAIDPLRAGVVSGRVIATSGIGLSAVTVEAVGLPQFGVTTTLADGTYNFVVNGGGEVVLRYFLDGHFEAQRRVFVEWGDYAVVDDVALVPPDNAVTEIDANAPVFQVARGSVVTDSDGTRQATVLFPPSTTATLVYPNGSMEPLTELNVRATEFTVDARLDTMPGDLPPESGYTYAVELSVDEAIAQGAARVDFNHAVPFYVDNFLSIPEGTLVPAGYYDRALGRWIPSANGVVLRILSTSGGAAAIDTNADGIADTAFQLTPLGITLAERQKLAQLYSAGKTLWRTPVSHFTPWDCNYAYGPPEDACSPNMSCGETPEPEHEPLDNETCETAAEEAASVVECNNQVLRETVAIAGTPFSLEYSSDRVLGFHADDTVKIPVTGPASIPGHPKTVELEIRIAGHKEKHSFSTAPNQVYTFTWDGLDRLGRLIHGSRIATVSRGYTYDAVYMRPPQVLETFAQFGDAELTGSRARSELTFWSTTKHELGGLSPNSAALGGWTLSEHHVYDPKRRVILRGDGKEEDPTQFVSQQMTTEAGTGEFGNGNDGPDALISDLAYPAGLTSAPDGTLYVSDTLNNRIRRVDRDGSVTTVVGDATLSNLLLNPSNEAPIQTVNAIPGWTVATGSTWQARSENPEAFEGNNYFYAGQAPLGELYQSVDVTAFAGTIDAGQQPFTFEGYVRSFEQAPHDASRIVVEYRDVNDAILESYDSGQIQQFAEWLHLTDTRVAPATTRRIRVRLIATRFVGSNNDGYFDALSLRAGTDLQVAAPLNQPHGLALGQDGSVYVADTNNNRICKFDPTGTFSTIAGTGIAGFTGDNGPAVTAKLNGPSAVAVASDGTLYIADTNNFRIRRVSTSGMISTVAGTGTSGNTGNNGLASVARIGTVEALAVAPDGSLLIAASSHHVVRSIGMDGRIRHFAGTANQAGFLGDGALATAARLNSPSGLVASNDGSVYIADQLNHRIRAVLPNRTIVTVAGNGTAAIGDEGTYALAASLSAPSAIAQTPDGALHIADTDNHRIRRISPSIPGYSTSDLVIASNNGSEIYHFTGEGLHLATVDALTGTTRYAFGYNTNHQLISITDHDGNVTTIERDSNGVPTAIVGPYGQTTTLTLSPQGYLETVSNPEGHTHEMDYTSGGLLQHFTTPNGGTAEMLYDPLGRLITDENAANAVLSFDRTENGAVTTVEKTSQLGRTTSYSTEELPTGDHRRTHTFPDGTQAVANQLRSGVTLSTLPNRTQIRTEQIPHPLWGTAVPLTSQTTLLPSGLQRVQTQSVDITLSDENNPLSILTRTETTSINGRTTTTTYDANTQTFTTASPMGRQTFRTIDDSGRTLSTQVADLTPIEFTYDSNGRLQTITQGDRTTTNTYHAAGATKGYLETITNALNQTTTFTPDSLGRTLTQTEPDGAEINFTYDGNDNLTSVTPPGKPEHLQTYTAVDLMETYEPPTLDNVPNPTTSYTYNADKQLTNVLRPDGVSLTRTYDPAGRLDLITMPTGTIQHQYYDNTLCAGCAPGSLKRLTGPGSSIIDLTYDGSLLKSTTWSGAVNGAVSWNYDSDFRTIAETVTPGGSTITYAYDDDNLVTCATRGTCTSADALKLTYHPTSGLLTSVMIGNVSETFTYDDKGELATHDATYNGSPVYAGVFHSTAAPRDNLGRITRKVETVSGVTRTDDYQYDTRGRLLNVARNNTLVSVYDYDDNGNRLSLTNPSTSTTTLGSYDDQDRVMAYGSFEYTFNANGDLTSKFNTATNEETTYEYDARGALISAVLPDSTVIEYVVDGKGRRIGKKVNGTLVQGFIYKDALRISAELNGAGAIVSQFVYVDDKSHSPDFMLRGGQVYRFVKDQLGSPRVVVNALTGAVAQTLEYDEFGNVSVDSAPGFQALGFAGGLYDRDTNLVRFGARDYDAAIGRWTAKDPIQWHGGMNMYVYVANNPVGIIDPEGTRLTRGQCGGIANGFTAFCILTVCVPTAVTWVGAAACAFACGALGNALLDECNDNNPEPPPEICLHNPSP